jgi:hypothetical protein
MSTNAKTTASRGRQSDGPAKVNPHAERIDADGFARLVGGFYGTKTFVFDRALAEAALVSNTGNRKVNRRKVEQLVRQMAAGEFENTGEPVILSAEGILNNGQHRLLAIIEADAVVEMDVRFGIPRSAFSKTDTGAARTGADVLTIKGVGSGGAVSSALRLLVLYRRGLPEAVREFVSNDELSRAFDAWPDIEKVVAAVNAHAFPKPVRSTPLYATAFLASRTSAKAKLEPWLDAVDTGLDVARDNPAYQLRERLIRGVDAPVGTREGQLERFALMIKSWNLWARGETVTKREFRWSSVGRAAEPFPVVAGARL